MVRKQLTVDQDTQEFYISPDQIAAFAHSQGRKPVEAYDAEREDIIWESRARFAKYAGLAAIVAGIVTAPLHFSLHPPAPHSKKPAQVAPNEVHPTIEARPTGGPISFDRDAVQKEMEFLIPAYSDLDEEERE